MCLTPGDKAEREEVKSGNWRVKSPSVESEVYDDEYFIFMYKPILMKLYRTCCM